MPTLPKIFRPITRNTLIFLFGLKRLNNCLKTLKKKKLLCVIANKGECSPSWCELQIVYRLSESFMPRGKQLSCISQQKRFRQNHIQVAAGISLDKKLKDQSGTQHCYFTPYKQWMDNLHFRWYFSASIYRARKTLIRFPFQSWQLSLWSFLPLIMNQIFEASFCILGSKNKAYHSLDKRWYRLVLRKGKDIENCLKKFEKTKIWCLPSTMFYFKITNNKHACFWMIHLTCFSQPEHTVKPV